MNNKTLVDELKSFGGHLKCNPCGRVRPLGNIGIKLANGWPKCCGYTMTWITEKQLTEEALKDETHT